MGLSDAPMLAVDRTSSGKMRREPTLVAASPENPSTNLADPSSWLLDWASGGSASGSFGPSVSETTSMACSAVYRCVTLISGLIAGLPFKIYQRTDTGRDEAPNHRLAQFFRIAPMPGASMTAYTWREAWSINTLLWGNHYSIIRYDGAARVVGFDMVYPWNVEVLRRAGRNWYRCVVYDGNGSEVVEYVDQEDMLHIVGPGFDGIKGVSRIRQFARDSISLAQLLQEQTGRVHDNSARPSGLLTVPANIQPEGLKRMRSHFEMDHVGRANAGKVMFGDVGTSWTPFQMSPEDLNTLEARRYQVADISRFFGVPLHLLNETDKSTSWGSGLSEQTLGMLIYTLDPELSRIEAEVNYKLFSGTSYYAEFDRDALMAMDPLKAAQVAQTEMSSGVLTPNEYRRKKNRPPIDGGDTAYINSTNVPLERQAEIPDVPSAPVTPAVE